MNLVSVRHDNPTSPESDEDSQEKSGYSRCCWCWVGRIPMEAFHNCHGEEISASISSSPKNESEKCERTDSKVENIKMRRSRQRRVQKSKRIPRRVSLLYDIIICSQFVLHTPLRTPPPLPVVVFMLLSFLRKILRRRRQLLWHSMCVYIKSQQGDEKIDIHTWFNKMKSGVRRLAEKVIRQRYADIHTPPNPNHVHRTQNCLSLVNRHRCASS